PKAERPGRCFLRADSAQVSGPWERALISSDTEPRLFHQPRVHTRITAPINETMIEPFGPRAWSSSNPKPPTIPPRIPKSITAPYPPPFIPFSGEPASD